MTSINDILKSVSPSESSLIPGDTTPFRLNVASSINAKDVNSFGCETRLASDSSPIDFAFNLSNTGLKNYAGGATPFESPEWTRIANICRDWGKSSIPEYSDGGALWLEFDAAMFTSKVPVPSIFMAGRSEAASDDKDRGFTIRPLEWLTDGAIATIDDLHIPESVRRHILHCIKLTPRGAEGFHLGVMVARRADILRLCVFGIAPAEIVEYLHAIGWSGQTAPIEDVLRKYATLVDNVCLHIDVGEKVYSRIGIELLLSGDAWSHQPHKNDRWNTLLSRLVEGNLCSTVKAEALLDWPGVVENEVQLIERIIRDAAYAGDSVERTTLVPGVIIKGLHHIKVSISGDGDVTAKAYYGIYQVGEDG